MPQPPEHGDSEILETMSGANPNTPAERSDSPSSEVDAGLDDPLMDDIDNGFGSDTELGDLDENLPNSELREIAMSDLDDAPNEDAIHSPELSDMNIPGELDIEGLDEDALTDAGLPPDALLDRLEP
jgi:hypothetical protein